MTGAADARGDGRAPNESSSAAEAAPTGRDRTAATGPPSGHDASSNGHPSAHSPAVEGTAPPSSEREGSQPSSAVDITLARLEDQIVWYDEKALRSQRWFKRVKWVELSIATLVPVIALVDVTVYLTALLGAIVVILQITEQLNQFQQNWITYRSTCEQLKHEKYLFHAGAGPYTNAKQPARRLAERIESLISQEHSKWVDNREEAAEQLQNAEAAS